MKAAIVTLHRVYNYGSVLQAYATQKVFEKHGCETSIVDYITEQRTLKRIFFKPPADPSIKGVKRVVYQIAKIGSLALKELTFGSFVRKTMRLTKRYVTADDLALDPPRADVYVSGSDQVWNSKYNEGIDRGFFLDFVPSGRKKISFASSFGKSALDEWEKEQTRFYLSQYAAISVREDSAVEIVEDLGVQGAVQVIDPTLQLTKSEWQPLASPRLVKDPYLALMLLYNEDNGATEIARQIADERGLKLVKISWEMKKPEAVDKLFTHRSPADFLSLFSNADFVVTNSFHGLAFSLIFERQFLVVPRNEFNSRIDSLLSLVGLSGRLVKKPLDSNQSLPVIDYSHVNKALNAARLDADRYIDEALGE